MDNYKAHILGIVFGLALLVFALGMYAEDYLKKDLRKKIEKLEKTNDSLRSVINERTKF